MCVSLWAGVEEKWGVGYVVCSCVWAGPCIPLTFLLCGGDDGGVLGERLLELSVRCGVGGCKGADRPEPPSTKRLQEAPRGPSLTSHHPPAPTVTHPIF